MATAIPASIRLAAKPLAQRSGGAGSASCTRTLATPLKQHEDRGTQRLDAGRAGNEALLSAPIDPVIRALSREEWSPVSEKYGEPQGLNQVGPTPGARRSYVLIQSTDSKRGRRRPVLAAVIPANRRSAPALGNSCSQQNISVCNAPPSLDPFPDSPPWIRFFSQQRLTR